MFELSIQQQPNRVNMAVKVVMSDGTEVQGQIEVPQEGGLPIVLNGLNQFIELRTTEGEMHYISKESMRTVRPIGMPDKQKFVNKLHRFMQADPHDVLGVAKNADEKTISASYKQQLKNFHEILDYLDTTYKCLNSAYKELGGAKPKTQNLDAN